MLKNNCKTITFKIHAHNPHYQIEIGLQNFVG